MRASLPTELKDKFDLKRKWHFFYGFDLSDLSDALDDLIESDLNLLSRNLISSEYLLSSLLKFYFIPSESSKALLITILKTSPFYCWNSFTEFFYYFLFSSAKFILSF